MRDNKGFTLIELLIVVVIIGILAAIAIPKFASTREKAYVSTMKSDLRNLATQQEIYFADEYTYADDATNADLGFTESEAVDVTINSADSNGWDATATHDALSQTCSMDYTNANAGGTITCTTP
jgi:prepilin-type N-terminal cleavage/methylation domain-containing protein